jgi:mono/diheme cytochrome c family protein
MKLNLFLVTVLVALVAANFGIANNPARRNFEAMPGMVRSLAYKSYSANPNFADGKTLQAPPEGTIPAGTRPPRAASSARGAQVYQVFCQPCHGVAGKGDGTVAARGFPPPPSFLSPKTMQLSDDQIFHILTYGQKNMPSYAAQVPPDDRWSVIAYVRSLQGGSRP